MYTPQIINEASFKSGNYITFGEGSPDESLDFVSSYNGDNYTPEFYKIRLIHLLENGVSDLTDDI
jgi:hypothetical protein